MMIFNDGRFSIEFQKTFVCAVNGCALTAGEVFEGGSWSTLGLIVNVVATAATCPESARSNCEMRR